MILLLIPRGGKFVRLHKTDHEQDQDHEQEFERSSLQAEIGGPAQHFRYPATVI
jgi:hypothetical protein